VTSINQTLLKEPVFETAYLFDPPRSKYFQKNFVMYIFHSKRDIYFTATQNDKIRIFSIVGSEWGDKSY
jgi:hypothetical protein